MSVSPVGEGGSSRSVAGRAGGNVTLPCRYNMTNHKQLSACWNRGDIPSSKCDNELIATDELGVREDSRRSSRYQLLGPLDQGDVSLTILNVTESDAGRYGCRVEIPGWFNDEKHHFDLTVDSGETGSSGVGLAAWKMPHSSNTSLFYFRFFE